MHHAYWYSFREVMVAMGQIPDDLFGIDASGIVTRCGQGVTQFKPGDRVCTLGHGTHRTIFRNKAAFCQLVPEGIPLEEAATIPLAHCTAYHALVNIAHAKPGQTVLIHAAAGGVGQSAIQLAQHLDLTIFATVGSIAKKELIQNTYGIHPHNIFNSRDLSFAKGVMRATKDRGVDIVLNSLSGEALRQSWQCIADFGVFIEIGMKDIMNNMGLEMGPFSRGATFTFFNVKQILAQDPKLLAELMEHTFANLKDGVIRPVTPIKVYPISDMESAFRLLQTGKHTGKLAFNWSCDDPVPIQMKGQAFLNPNVTYLIAGFGGIGRSLAQFLVESGARNLALLSRTKSKAQEMVARYEERGVRVRILECDISDRKSLSRSLKDCASDMPPIRGLFQCAMVLQDSIFEKMSHQQWTTTIRAKVQGSLNLHLLLPNLDFFIMLSSFAAIFGNRSQANYTAAGAFQDALALARRSLGQNAVAIDLGVMRDVGVIAEKGATDYLKEWEIPFGMRENELHELVKSIIINREPDDVNGSHSQIIHGLSSKKMIDQAGLRTPFYFKDPRFSILTSDDGGASSTTVTDTSTGAGAASAPPLQQRLSQSKTSIEATKAVTDALVERVAKSVQMDASEIDDSRALHSYGVDSLVGVEIANWVFQQTKVKVSIFDVIATTSIAAFAKGVASKSPLCKLDG